jgi:hypothetical protein
MTDLSPDFRALCAELADELDAETGYLVKSGERITHETVTRARAALATPPPKPPTLLTAALKLREENDLSRLFLPNPTTPPKLPSDEELDELFIEIDQSGVSQAWRPFARAALERWRRDSRNDDDCISPQDLHDIARSLREGRKGLSKHIVYFQDEGKDKGIGVWAKNEEEAEVLAMETYAQIKKARATELEGHG